jgi:quinoprotein glucose dehydrogenase
LTTGFLDQHLDCEKRWRDCKAQPKGEGYELVRNNAVPQGAVYNDTAAQSNLATVEQFEVTRFLLLTTRCLVGFLVGASCGPAWSRHAHTTWSDYGGTPDAAQYSSLTGINRGNVSQLQIAWKFPTGDANKYLFNPIVAHNVMYVLVQQNSLAAIDAATGRRLWIHRTDPDSRLLTTRGINYWESADGSDRRLLFAENNYLQELNAKTGEPIARFGGNGRVDLRAGLGRDPKSLSLVQSGTPGRVFENLIILGSATNEEYASGPGDIRAYNVRTGRLVWTFHTVPHPGEFGYDTWPRDAWKTVGGANAWSGMSLDEKRGIVFVPTASPKYNFYGANRPGANLFGDSLLALEARTGKRIWHFQMVHHDIWDYDNAATPQLLTVLHNGKRLEVVAEANKEGFVWVFDRATGKPIWPIEERPVPQSDMPGEKTWPTQPFPVAPPPFARQRFTANDLNPFISEEERAKLRAEVEGARNQGMFTPPSTQNTVEMPGNNGGANFGGAASDPERGYLYVVSKDLPAMLKLELDHAIGSASSDSMEQRGRAVFVANCRLCHGSDLRGQPPAVPALTNVSSRLSAREMRAIVRQGNGPMPAFAALPDSDLDNLLAYLAHPERATATETAADTPVPPPADAHYRSGFGFMFTSTGLPAISPPWTTLTAYDLNTGSIRWQIPLGEVPELAAEGHKDTGSHFPKVGPVVTAGGLIFTGTRDRKVRAIDSDTGKVLWETTLDAALEGMPAVYEIDGREFVVFCAAAQATTYTHDLPGHPASKAAIPGAYVAFALPRK